MSDSHAQDERPPRTQPARSAATVCPGRSIRVALRPLHAARFPGRYGLGPGIPHHCHGHSFPWLNTSTPCIG
ncbi:hypothetical protein GFK97_14480 [Pseudomonas stutzeri]|nr:hypothetical protein [Stutzerimonas stutzeri]